MLSKFKFWLECSRWYTLPMSFFAWLVIFVYSFKNGGNFLYGIIALLGILSAHLATNLFDDYCDYKILLKYKDNNGNLVLPNTQRGKCRYLLNGSVNSSDMLRVIYYYCTFSFCVVLFFTLVVSYKVLWFMLSGGLIVLFYSFLSRKKLSELAVALAFAPILYSGVYLVMCGHLSVKPLILSLPTLFFTVNLLYTDNFLDKDIDRNENKKTIANSFFSDKESILFLITIILFGYLSLFIVYVSHIVSEKVFLVFLTLPLSFDLVKSLKLYSYDKTIIPNKKWFHFPFEDWNDIIKNRSASFMFRMYQARNIMIYNSIILSFVILFSTIQIT